MTPDLAGFVAPAEASGSDTAGTRDDTADTQGDSTNTQRDFVAAALAALEKDFTLVPEREDCAWSTCPLIAAGNSG
jgi:ribosomal protein S5